jgi:hypothetical protein
MGAARGGIRGYHSPVHSRADGEPLELISDQRHHQLALVESADSLADDVADVNRQKLRDEVAGVLD